MSIAIKTPIIASPEFVPVSNEMNPVGAEPFAFEFCKLGVSSGGCSLFCSAETGAGFLLPAGCGFDCLLGDFCCTALALPLPPSVLPPFGSGDWELLAGFCEGVKLPIALCVKFLTLYKI